MKMFYTTLNKIRACSLCQTGWEKLLAHLGKTKADDEPLPFSIILKSNGLDDALWCCRAAPEYAREGRLYAVWCARQVQHLMTDQRSTEALDIAERYANGLATEEELAAARAAAGDAARAAARAAARDAARAAARAAAGDAARAAAWDAAWDAARAAAGGAAWDAARAAARAAARDVAWDAARAAARAAAGDAARAAARDAAWDAARAAAAGDAAWAAAWAAAKDAQAEEFKRVIGEDQAIKTKGE
jgi:hypothetical protein